jgi:O-acetyl-ADP-ribose deacetylase (regulator of RNase III)
MSLEFKTGNLFSYAADGYAHGCNCQGVMGAGIALEFRDRYPEMFAEYRKRCRDGSFNLGSCFAWKAPSGQMIYNLGTQIRPGRYATLESVEVALTTMLRISGMNNPPGHLIAIPRIGCGLGGLNWNDVRLVIERVVAGQNHTDVVVISQ